MSGHEVALMRKQRDGFLGIALQIFVTGGARPLIVLLSMGMAVQTGVHGRRDCRLVAIGKRLVAARAVLFGQLNVLGVRQLESRGFTSIGSGPSYVGVTVAALASLFVVLMALQTLLFLGKEVSFEICRVIDGLVTH